MLDPFHILGIEKDATTDEVQRAYRKKAAKHHPDAGGDAWAFKCVQHAYDEIMRLRQPKQSKNTRPKPSKQNATAQPKARPQQPPNQKTRQKPGSTDQPEAKQQSKTKANHQAKPNSQAKPNKKPRESSNRKPFAEKAKSWGASSKRWMKDRKLAWSQKSKQQPSNKSSTGNPSTGNPSTENSFGLRQFLTGHLPLQTEVSFFILIGVLDIVMTNVLLRHGAVEANPVAGFFLRNWGFRGMIAFKMATITFVIVLAQIVAQYKMSNARRLLHCGTAIVGFVVCYSVFLLLKKL